MMFGFMLVSEPFGSVCSDRTNGKGAHKCKWMLGPAHLLSRGQCCSTSNSDAWQSFIPLGAWDREPLLSPFYSPSGIPLLFLPY